MLNNLSDHSQCDNKPRYARILTPAKRFQSLRCKIAQKQINLKDKKKGENKQKEGDIEELA